MLSSNLCVGSLSSNKILIFFTHGTCIKISILLYTTIHPIHISFQMTVRTIETSCLFSQNVLAILTFGNDYTNIFRTYYSASMVCFFANLKVPIPCVSSLLTKILAYLKPPKFC